MLRRVRKLLLAWDCHKDVHTYEDQYDFSQQGTREVDDEIASQENDDEIASQEIEDEIGSKLDHVMEAQRLEQDMRKIGGSSNGGTKRQSINAYHALHPLFMEMMSAPLTKIHRNCFIFRQL